MENLDSKVDLLKENSSRWSKERAANLLLEVHSRLDLLKMKINSYTNFSRSAEIAHIYNSQSYRKNFTQDCPGKDFMEAWNFLLEDWILELTRTHYIDLECPDLHNASLTSLTLKPMNDVSKCDRLLLTYLLTEKHKTE